jgi:RNA polymerase sigma-70 factor (ECF subfamily)
LGRAATEADAQDVLHETLQELCHSKAFMTVAVINDADDLKKYVFASVTNRCFGWHGHRNRAAEMPLERMGTDDNPIEIEIVDDRSMDPESAAINEQRKRIITGLLSSLPPRYVTVLTLYYFEHRSFKEIAAILHTTEEAAKVRAFRAKHKLNEALLAQGMGAGRI